MYTNVSDDVHILPNTGWDPRIILCQCDTIEGLPVTIPIVLTERYVILIDTLVNQRTGAALLHIASPHITSMRPLLVVNTHADWDHCWGNQLFAGPNALEYAPIIASRRCAERLRAPEAEAVLAELRAANPMRYSAVRITPPTIIFDDRLMIDGGDLHIELFPTPGHTPDHTSVWLPEIRTLHAGDAAESPLPFVDTVEGLQALRRSLKAMAALDPAATLYCHAPPEQGYALLQHNIAYFDRLEARCRAVLSDSPAKTLEAEADLEQFVDLPFEAALPPPFDGATLPSAYREAHHTAIRLMLTMLSSGT